MMNWRYQELINSINSDIEDSLEMGLNYAQACSRCIDEFSHEIKNGYASRYIIYVEIANILIEKNQLSNVRRQEIIKLLDEVDLSIIDSELNPKEAIILKENIQKLNIIL